MQKVVDGLLRGIEDTLADPDAAFAITRQHIPEMDDASAVLQRAVLEECLTFWETDKPGYNEPADWQESVQLLADLGLLKSDLPATEMYTNRFTEP